MRSGRMIVFSSSKGKTIRRSDTLLEDVNASDHSVNSQLPVVVASEEMETTGELGFDFENETPSHRKVPSAFRVSCWETGRSWTPAATGPATSYTPATSLASSN